MSSLCRLLFPLVALKGSMMSKKHTIFFIIFLSIISNIISGFCQKSEITDWTKLSMQNSIFNISNSDIEKKSVWAVMQARIFNNNNYVTGIGGFMGTSWILQIKDDLVLFITAEHVMRNAFQSETDTPDTILVFLSNVKGFSCNIQESDIKFPGQDIAFIRVNLKRIIPSIEESKLFELNNSYSITKNLQGKLLKGRRVLNIGFPDRAQKNENVYFNINIDHPPVSSYFDKGPWVQNGAIIDVIDTTIRSNDVNISNARCIKLDYTSENGFSGGPLILENRYIIGMMLAVIPTKNNLHPKECLALHIDEILKLLNE